MKILVTHRGTTESIRQKQKEMLLRANYPYPNNKITRLFDGKDKVVWVSKGEPNFWNKIWSGMCGDKGEACIIFQIEKNRLRKPKGIKWIFGLWIFGHAQLVIDEDVIISNDAQFIYTKRIK